jgi:hypothetical protein
MNITINVHATSEELNQAQIQTIRRVANVLRIHNLNVDIAWEDKIPELIPENFLFEKMPPAGDKRL